MSDLCSTCLSSNRRLSPLRALMQRHVLNSIFWLDIELNMERDCVCWECSAMLLKIQQFQEQVVRAQYMLTRLRITAQPPQHSESLSKLTMHTNKNYDSVIIYDETIMNEGIDKCGEVKIKIETDLNNEDGFNLQNTYQSERDNRTSDVIEKLFEEASAVYEATEINPNNLERKRSMQQKEETKRTKKGTKETRLSISENEALEAHENDLIKDADNIFCLNAEGNDDSSVADELENRLCFNKPEDKGDFKDLNTEEDKYIVKTITMEEVLKARESDSNSVRFKLSAHKCVACIKTFCSKKKYNSHVKQFHSKKTRPFECSICCGRFSQEDALHLHYETHFKRYECRSCPYWHARLRRVEGHAAAEHGTRPLECTTCHETFFSIGKLKYHRAKAHKKRETCKICNKGFTTLGQLKRHLKSHGERELHECPQCGGKYRQLHVHMTRTHAPAPGGEDAYCVECGRQFRNVYIYRTHLRTHARHRQPEALRYPCPHCDSKFMLKNDITRHVAAMHTKQYPYRCNTCDKGFCRKNVLRIHIQEKHEGIPRPKDKICGYCGRGFKDRKVLKHHERTHTGEKPYACAQCPWRFAQRSALKTHERALHKKPEVSSAREDIGST